MKNHYRKNNNNVQDIHWKEALNKNIIKKAHILKRAPKNFVYGLKTGTIEYTPREEDIKYNIIIDDEWLHMKLQYEIYPYLSNKTDMKKCIDNSWVDLKKQEIINMIEKIKQEALKSGIDINLKELLGIDQ